MRQIDYEKDMEAIENLRRKNIDKNWKIVKIRHEKSLPNSIETAKQIEDSICETINLQELIKKGKEINQKVYG